MTGVLRKIWILTIPEAVNYDPTAGVKACETLVTGSDDVGADAHGFVEDLFFGNHHPEVHDVEAVAGHDDANDVFADVMHVAFHCGQQNGARALLVPGFRFFVLED